ncbi:MAG: hypothetical protein WBP26_03940 [Candidatus Saccharimonadales bacterium]
MADNINAISFMPYSYGPPQNALRNGIADSNYTATTSDTIVALTSLSAARIITLPAANTFTGGQQIIIKDESGSCSSGNTITVAGTIDGGTNYVLNSAYASVRLYSNGSSWHKVGA